MKFIDICKMTQGELKAVLVSVLKTFGYKPVVKDGFIYAEGTVPVLLAAHMDTVHKERCSIICSSQNGDCIMSPQGIGGDDRCGIFMILETIKELRCSVLFTEDEEIGCVGAEKFCKSGIEPSVPLNYIIEFDRKNADDAVFYDCDNPEFEDFVTDKTIGFKTAYGSCSDISHIAPHLGIAAVNLSCGYYNQHTQHEYVIVSEMIKNINRGKQLIRKPCDKPFEYIEKVYSKWNWGDGYGSYGRYGSYGGYGEYNYGSKKSLYGDHYFDSYEEIYENIDEVALSMYQDAYGIMAKKKNLVPVKELCDYGTKEFIVHSSEGTMALEDYGEADIMYIDIEGCEIYFVTSDNSWGISTAVYTGDTLVHKDGSTIMYYKKDLEEFPVLDSEEQRDFDDYVDNYMEYDIEYNERLGTLL